MDRKYVSLSKFMSLVLRHQPELLNININDDGYIDISLKEFANRISKRSNYHWVTLTDIHYVIDHNAKGRFVIDNGKLRSKYGHSVQVNLLKKSDKSLPNILYHGTSPANKQNIMRYGLDKRSRQNVHFSDNHSTAFNVGKRHSSHPIIFTVKTKELINDGFIIKKVNKDTYITDNIPPKYLYLNLKK